MSNAMSSHKRKSKSPAPSPGNGGAKKRGRVDEVDDASQAPAEPVDGVVIFDDDFSDSGLSSSSGRDGPMARKSSSAPAPADAMPSASSEGSDRRKRITEEILKDVFGHDEFRHEQEAAIQAILSGRNAAVIFPTGAGKSLCYQIPAIAFARLDEEMRPHRRQGHGITIVVSPLLALMKDQVDALQKKGVAADRIDSSRTADEVRAITSAMQNGSLRLLYCAPERLVNEMFVEVMKKVTGGVRLIAVDEAHCISEWGHSFRPDYLKIARFTKEIGAETVLCLTATATPRVAEDICKGFDISASHVFRTVPYRPNLHLDAMSFETKEDKVTPLYEWLKAHPGPTIVYVTLQHQAEYIAQMIVTGCGLHAVAFHAGMKNEDKKEVQEDFMADKIQIIVATIAFGMGIDKANIRGILHYDVPASVEEYSQQIGRAGRDGKPAFCVTFLCPQDLYIRESFARGDLPSLRSIEGLLQEIMSTENTDGVHGSIFMANAPAQSKAYDIRATALANIYAILELKFGLVRSITPEYTEFKFTAAPSYRSLVESDPTPVAKAILKHAKLARKWHSIDLADAAAKTRLGRADLLCFLNGLHGAGTIQLSASGIRQRYRVTAPLPKTAREISALAGSLFEELQSREAEALVRCRQVTDLITGSRCLALGLAEHFGMSLPGGQQHCSHCSFCRTDRPAVMPRVENLPTNHKVIKKVLEAVPERDDPRFLARVAFGIKSPRVTAGRYDKMPVFMSLADHDFTSLLAEFEKACEMDKGSG